eukprot:361323-Chlamydomonas_euryale.AAC.6
MQLRSLPARFDAMALQVQDAHYGQGCVRSPTGVAVHGMPTRCGGGWDASAWDAHEVWGCMGCQRAAYAWDTQKRWGE